MNSGNVSLVLIATVSTLSLILLLRKISSKEKKIPGPFALPIIGNLHQLAGKDKVLLAQEWAKKFGDIYSIKFGSQTLIYINGVEIAKEIFIEKAKCSIGRPNFPTLEVLGIRQRGVVFSEGEMWRNARKCFITNLTNRVPHEIFTELAKFGVDELGKLADQNKPLEKPNNLFKQIAFKMINSLALNACPLNKDLENDIIKFAEQAAIIAVKEELHNIFPIVPYSNEFKIESKSYCEERDKILNQIIDMHKEKLDPNNPRDYLDILLVSMEKENWDHSELLERLVELYAAGIDTNAFTSSWFLAYMIKYPEVQKKVREELDMVIGKNRSAKFEDMVNLPYFNSTLNEVMRICTVVPESVIHRATEDFEVAGYTIKKDDILIPHLHNLNHDEKFWVDPESFRPERFLNWDTTNIQFSPFGIGPRICAGQKIAKANLFYVLVNFILNFEFSAVNSNFEIPDRIIGMVLVPTDFKIIVKRR